MPADRTPEERAREWPEPKITNPDIADPTGVPYIDCLIDRLLDAQQDITLACNTHMDQSLGDAAALIDEVETALRTIASAIRSAVSENNEACAKIAEVTYEDDAWHPLYRNTARTIAAAIRTQESSDAGE